METVTDFIILGSKITADGDCTHEIKWCLLLGRKLRTNLDSILKSRDIALPTKVHLVKAMIFSVVMYRCESWTKKKAECQRIDAFVVLEKTLESLLDCKEIQSINPKGSQSWIFIGRTDSGTEAPIFWPPDVRNILTGKDAEARKDWRQEEKGKTEDKMVGWHHQLPELAQTHVHWVHLILCHPLSPPALSLSQHQGVFQWVGSSNKVANILEVQLQHQSFQWILRVDFL